MGKGLGSVYAKKWRNSNPETILAYKKSVNGKYSQLRRAAKRAGRILELSLAEYAEAVKDGICHYCKGPLSNFGYSIDRLDHKKDYSKSNSVPCCGVRYGERNSSCNMRKGHLESIGFVYPRTVELLMELLDKEKDG